MNVLGSFGELDWPNKSSNRTYLRYRFLEIIEEIGQQVLEELHGGPFQHYMRPEMEQVRQLNLRWTDIAYRIRRLPTQVQAFHQSLKGWANNRNLNSEWCVEQAYKTVYLWANSSEESLKPLFFSLDGWGGTIPSDAPLPPAGLPEYKPLNRWRSTYIADVREMAAQAISNQPILCNGHASYRRAFIETIVEKADQYCESIEHHYLARGFVRSEEGSTLTRDMAWTVRFQVLKESYSKIATAEGVAASTVQRPVDDLLGKLGLQKRPDSRRGRPKGSKNTNAGILRKLGRD